ncbi:beta-1,4-galactosyltransferase galt-1 isoform X2 [Bombina bombina]|nr:beta-1,4-galactosyltransferase galt-1 isoform X2 [Bombina bombina]XP_053551366.1 beta-1,4-galactosyltransferase galt-1 isoform X2 [Bombina bombina]
MKTHIPVQAQLNVPSDRFGFTYSAVDVLCRVPPSCDSKFVSVHWSTTENISYMPMFEIKNRDVKNQGHGKFTVDFTICISTMYGNSTNILQFIQAIEMYKLLGVQKVVIYKNGCSVPMERVLDYYIKEGVLDIVPWPLNKYLKTSGSWHYAMDPTNDIGYFGQLAVLNDCMYRNMYTSKYVLFNDIDEIILPKIHKDWKEMMEFLEKQYPNTPSFLIENHYFPIHIQDSTFNKTFPITVPGINILQHIYFEPEQENVYNNHKIIVNPRKIIQTAIHFVLKAYGDSVIVPDNMASLHHCREGKQPNLPFTSLIRDTTIWKNNVSLIKNVKSVLRNVSNIE